jgi:hypothetical protein
MSYRNLRAIPERIPETIVKLVCKAQTVIKSTLVTWAIGTVSAAGSSHHHFDKKLKRNKGKRHLISAGLL